MVSIENGETGLSVRAKLNAAFADLDAVTGLANASTAYADRAAATAATVPVAVMNIHVVSPSGHALSYVRNTEGASGLALTTNGGDVQWMPDRGFVTPDHWAENTTPGTTSMTAALQAAVDFLPDRGGILHCISDVSTATAPTIPNDKGVTFVVHGDGALPSSIEVLRISSGEFDQPHAGGAGASIRPGTALAAFVGKHSVKTVSNQQDSMLYIEGEQVAPYPTGDTEFAGVRVNMRSSATETGAALRGLHMTVTGVGGQAKLRCLRSTTIGLNGHDGLCVGAMVSATRTGIIPTSAGGDGVTAYATGDAGPYPNSDSAMVAQVGPGIRNVFKAEGFGGKERPQVVFQQGFGAQAVLPENAAMQLHGGGNGRIIEVFDDENAGSVIASLGRLGDQTAKSFRSNFESVTLDNDTAIQINLTRNGGFLFVYAASTSTVYSASFIRAIAAASANAQIAKGANMDLSTGALTGTTGTVGNARVSVDGQSFWIENRTSVTRNFVWALIG